MSSTGPIVVVIPACNEASRVPRVLQDLAGLRPDGASLSMLVVDDGSTDDTAAVARAHGAAVLRLPVNRGKGGALLAGVGEAQRRGAAVIVLMDADGQHRAEDLPRLLAPIMRGEAEVSLGAREFTDEMPWLFRFGNRLLSAVVGLLYGIRVMDSQCGLRAFTAAAVDDLRWSSTGYAVETEMLVRLAGSGLRWQEVPIPSLYLDRSKGTRPSDGVVILGKLLAWRLTGPPPPPPAEVRRPTPTA